MSRFPVPENEDPREHYNPVKPRLDPHHELLVGKLATALKLVDRVVAERGYTELRAVLSSVVDDAENLGAGRHVRFGETDWDTTLHEWLEVFLEDHR